MKTCPKCNVTILDDTDRCPLCRHALGGSEGGLRSYPDAMASIRKARIFENLVLFLSIIASITVVVVNYMTGMDSLWSLIVVLSLFYVNVVIRYAVLGQSGYQAKLFILVLIAIVVLFGIDYLTGFNRWSLTFVYPSLIIAVDVGLLILMLVNKRNWQSYIMPQLAVFILSLVSAIFVWVGLNNHPLLGLIASGFALFEFLGTIILGDQRARNELKRRFHI